MDGIEARIKGALLGVVAAPFLFVCGAFGMASFGIMGTVAFGVFAGEPGAALGSTLGALFGALLAGGFAVRLLGEVQGGPGLDGVRRVLVVLGLASIAAAGTWLSPFLGRLVAPLATIAAFAATAALAGAALLTPYVEPPLVPLRRRRREDA